MKTRVIEAIKDMESQISRDSKHMYRNKITGDVYQGVSTVSSVCPKDWLAAWGAKECVKALGYNEFNDFTLADQVLGTIKGFTKVSDYIKLLTEAKGASSRKSKTALLDGKAGHAWLEEYVKSKLNGTKIPNIPNKMLERPIRQFVDWANENVKEWVASEAFIVRPDKGYAGQLDSVYIDKHDRLCLGDFKFASHVSEDYYLQTAGYAAAFEPYGIKFDKRVIIRLPKTLEIESWDPKTFKRSMVPNVMEVHDVPTKYEVDRDAFFHALPVKQWVNYVTAFKDNKK